MLRTVQATRYVAPLREGGSVPALVEADDEGLYVVKLRGAAQGIKALIAEVLAGELIRAVGDVHPDLGLLVPDVVLVDLPAALSVAEPDPEIQDHIAASAGINAGLDHLPRALPYAPDGRTQPAADTAAAIVWLDALLENVDRTPRNPNLLAWHGRVWLIDQGASLYRHHAGLDPARATGPFVAIRDHVLLPRASSITDVDRRIADAAGPAAIAGAAALVPDAWMALVDPDGDAARARALYVADLSARHAGRTAFVEEAERARTA
ncbi:MAG: aminotransferase class I and II [Solirubrobacteraceae bacterium]|nr:aminotransferase class I and II [Solirubrobacteraceae bacterium]